MCIKRYVYKQNINPELWQNNLLPLILIPLKTLTALPVRVAHLQVPAGSGRVLSASIRAADLLDLLAQAFQGAVNLQVTVTENISIISTEHTEGIRGLLLGLGNESEVKSTTRGTRCTRRSRRSRRALNDENGLVSFLLTDGSSCRENTTSR